MLSYMLPQNRRRFKGISPTAGSLPKTKGPAFTPDPILRCSDGRFPQPARISNRTAPSRAVAAASRDSREQFMPEVSAAMVTAAQPSVGML